MHRKLGLETWRAGVEWQEVVRRVQWSADIGEGRRLMVMEMMPDEQWGARLYERGFRVDFPDGAGDTVFAFDRRAAMARAMDAAEALGWIPPPEGP